MAEGKRVIVTGATGMLGRRICAQLKHKGYDVVVFSRDPVKARQILPGAAEYVAWTAAERGPWARAVDGAYAVIHMAGAPVLGKRWTTRYKTELLDSRVVSTHGLVDAMAAATHKPRVFVCSSAVGYYGFRDATPLDESAAPGSDFLARIVIAWEQEARRANDFGIRTVMVRTGIVLDREEGGLPPMQLPFRFFVGGPILPGSQWFPWIHMDDEIGIIMFALEDERVEGPVNAVAPEPQTNRDFGKTLGKVMHRPAWLPVPRFALRILLGEVAGTLANGQRPVPNKLLDLGFRFQYRTSEQALRQIFGKSV